MGISRTVAGLGLGVAVVAAGAAVLVAGASSSAAATSPTHPTASTAVPAVSAVSATAPAAVAATPVDVTVTSRQQVAWTRRAEADTSSPPNRCTPVTGLDGTQLRDPDGGLVYPALIDDAEAEADIGAMYAAMAAGDQSAYDAAYHALDLRVTCN